MGSPPVTGSVVLGEFAGLSHCPPSSKTEAHLKNGMTMRATMTKQSSHHHQTGGHRRWREVIRGWRGLCFFFFPSRAGQSGMQRGLPLQEKKKKNSPREKKKKLTPTQHSAGTQCTLIGWPTYNRCPSNDWLSVLEVSGWEAEEKRTTSTTAPHRLFFLFSFPSYSIKGKTTTIYYTS